MAEPPSYDPEYSFSAWQASNPTKPLPAQQVDNELANVSQAVNSTQDALRDIRRSDGAVQNRSIGYDQLKPELNGFGFNPPTNWMPNTAYIARDTVFANAAFWMALVSHTSSANFQDDVDAGAWDLVADFTAATSEAQAFADAAALSATNAAGSASAASGSASAASGSASAAAGSAGAAATNASNAAADRVQTGLDRVATGQDRVATAADRVQTGADRVQTGLDRSASAPSASDAAASASAVQLPTPVANTFLQRNSGNTAYITRTAALTRDAITASSRLAAGSLTITDWNAATESGWYFGDTAASNSPVAGAAWIGEVVASGNNARQRVWPAAGGADLNTTRERFMRAGVWGPWLNVTPGRALVATGSLVGLGSLAVNPSLFIGASRGIEIEFRNIRPTAANSLALVIYKPDASVISVDYVLRRLAGATSTPTESLAQGKGAGGALLEAETGSTTRHRSGKIILPAPYDNTMQLGSWQLAASENSGSNNIWDTSGSFVSRTSGPIGALQMAFTGTTFAEGNYSVYTT